MENRICPNCGETFEPNHGNRVYCCPNCYEQFKKTKQKENNELMKKCRLGFIRNYKLFTSLLPEAGEFEIPLFQLLTPGFDENAFYGSKIDKETGKHWHKVNNYLFNVTVINTQPVLFLYKP